MINVPFSEWFTTNQLIGGDWRFFWPENLIEILSYSYAWDPNLNSGMGQSNIHILWLNTYLAVGAHLFTQILHVPWGIAEKLLFFWPIVFLSFFSGFFLARSVGLTKLVCIIGGILYLTNTYAMMVFGGGQVGVGLAYAVAPLVLGTFVKLYDNLSQRGVVLKFSLWVSLVVAMQILFDPRIALLTLLVSFAYGFLYIRSHVRSTLIFGWIMPISIVSLLHAFWLLPIVFIPTSLAVPTGGGEGISSFLSFAQFSNTLTLLHPNWPENIFGKIYFLRPEFLVLPILAYSSLFFHWKDKKIILFFATLGLIGAFFAKGTHPPVGELYTWMGKYIPVFQLFRDPTKFYILIVLSYSVLIPFTVQQVYAWIAKKNKFSTFKLQNLFLLLVAFYLFFLIRPFWMGELGGTFAKHEVPKEYVELKDFLDDQPEFFRTLWIPKWQRFGFSSINHPALDKEDLNILEATGSQVALGVLGVRYVIVPFDSNGEIFLNDRIYDEKKYLETIEQLEKMPQLKKLSGFDKVVLFEVTDSKDHFWIEGEERKISWKMVNPTHYTVQLENDTMGRRLVFAERFHPDWVAKTVQGDVQSEKYMGFLNSFKVADNAEILDIYFHPQKWVAIGHTISIGTLVGALLTLAFLQRKGKKPL